MLHKLYEAELTAILHAHVALLCEPNTPTPRNSLVLDRQILYVTHD